MIHVAVNVHYDVWSKAIPASTGRPFCPLCPDLADICAFCGLIICVILFPFIYHSVCIILNVFVSNVHHDEPIIKLIGLIITVLIYLLMVNLMVKCQKSTNIQMQTNTQTQSQDLAVEIPIGSSSSGQIEI